MPALPKLHDGRPSVLRLAHAIDGETSTHMVLQVGATNIKLTSDDGAVSMPLCVGPVVTQHRHQLLGLVPLERALPATGAAQDQLAKSLDARVMFQRSVHSSGK